MIFNSKHRTRSLLKPPLRFEALELRQVLSGSEWLPDHVAQNDTAAYGEAEQQDDGANGSETPVTDPPEANLSGAMIDAATGARQATGIDEGDIVQVAGDYIYYISSMVSEIPMPGQSFQLVTIDAHDPSQPVVASRINFFTERFSGELQRLYLVEDRLVVVSLAGVLQIPSTESKSSVKLTVFDISDGSPQLMHETTIESEFESYDSFQMGSFLYIEAVSKGPVNVTKYGPDGTVWETGAASADTSGDSNADAAYTTSIMSFDITTDTIGPIDSFSVTGRAFSEVTGNSLYWTSTRPDWKIQKIALHSDGTFSLVAEGSFPFGGWNFVEHNGYLRVDDGSPWSPSILSVVEQQNDQLVVVSQIEDLRYAKATFFGDHAFLAGDGLIQSLDLSDPHNPVLLDELSTPGDEWQYLQLLDENHLLAVGGHVDRMSHSLFFQYQGMQISIIDISDPHDLQLRERRSFEGSIETTWNVSFGCLLDGGPWCSPNVPAVSYFPDDQLLAFSFHMGIFASPASWTESFVATFRLDSDSQITPLGIVNFDHHFDQRMLRTVVLDDSLYVLSPTTIKVVDVHDSTDVKAVIYIGEGAEDEGAVTVIDRPISIDVITRHETDLESRRVITSVTEPSNGGSVRISDDAQVVVYTPPVDFIGEDRFAYTLKSSTGLRSTAYVTVRVTESPVGPVAPPEIDQENGSKQTWHNGGNPMDTNHDGIISPLDVLVQINYLNRYGTGSINELSVKLASSSECVITEPKVDANNDGVLSAFDVLMIVNYLNLAIENDEPDPSEGESPDLSGLDAIFHQWDHRPFFPF